MSDAQLRDALNHCIDRLAEGQSLDDCVRDYPELENELRSLLEIGQATGFNRANQQELNDMHIRLDGEIENLIANTDFGAISPFRFPQGLTVLLVSLVVVAIGITVFLNEGRDNTGGQDTETSTIEVTEQVTESPTVMQTFTPTVTQTEPPTQTLTLTPTMTLTMTATVTQTASPTTTSMPTLTGTPVATKTPSGGGIATDEVFTESVSGANSDDCPIPSGWFEYRIKSGDSLSLIAVNSGTTVDILRESNCLDSPIIIEGEILYVPRLWDSGNSEVDDGDNGSSQGDFNTNSSSNNERDDHDDDDDHEDDSDDDDHEDEDD